MGFGHRVYKTWDPRATFLRQVLMEMDGQLPGAHACWNNTMTSGSSVPLPATRGRASDPMRH